jgi:glutamyl/glutaminyl-tRNA synthetase
LDSVGKKGAIFDTVKLDWVNAQFILRSTPKALLEYMKSIELMPEYLRWNQEQLIMAIELCKERVSTLKELVVMLDQIYHEPNFKNGIGHSAGTQSLFSNFDAQVSYCVVQLQQADANFGKDSVTRMIKECAKKLGIPYPLLCKQLRFALIGVAEGVSIVEIMMILQKEETVRRIERSKTILKVSGLAVV